MGEVTLVVPEGVVQIEVSDDSDHAMCVVLQVGLHETGEVVDERCTFGVVNVDN